ncbi:MAG: DNA primase [Firmicutes bacterium]|nr:DNA primase [Bacillota bacterium]
MFYPEDIIEQVRAENDIVDVISAYVPLKQRGGYYFGLCPFHKEKSPSFSVNRDRQTYHCFGCGAAGNVYTFIMERENYAFPEAVRFLADRVRISLPEQTRANPSDIAELMRLKAKKADEALKKEAILAANKAAARYFFDSLNGPQGKQASDYLDARGVSGKMRRRFGLGYCPGGGLLEHLMSQGSDQETALAAGLIAKSEKGAYYNRFFGRLMFPIFDIGGNITGFGGRVIADGEPKYLNSAENPVFEKSRNLYGVNFARKTRRREVVIVEGYMDVIALHQAGFENAVAALGTAFNEEHVRTLKRINVAGATLLFDSDAAGVKAALRAIPVLTGGGLAVRVARVTDAKDPDEYIKKFGAERFNEILNKAPGHITFRIDVAHAAYDLDKLEERVKFTTEVAGILSSLENPIEIEAYAGEVSRVTGISPEAIKARVFKGGSGRDTAPAAVKLNSAYLKNDNMNAKGVTEAQKNLLSLMCVDQRAYAAAGPYVTADDFPDGDYRELYGHIARSWQRGLRPAPASLVSQFDTAERQRKIAEVFDTPANFDDKASLEKALNDFVRKLKISSINVNNMKEISEESLDWLKKTRESAITLNIKISDG